ncbi:MAG: hypothetical protein ABI480_03720 [Chitinophagaceae bacterium]
MQSKPVIYREEGLDSIPTVAFKNKSIQIIDLSPALMTIPPGNYIVRPSFPHRIRVLPENICELKKLKTLNLTGQNIIKFNDCLYDLPKLEYIDLSYNDKFDLPDLWKNVNRLKVLKTINLFGIDAAIKDSSIVRSKIDTGKIRIIITQPDFQNWINQNSGKNKSSD